MPDEPTHHKLQSFVFVQGNYRFEDCNFLFRICAQRKAFLRVRNHRLLIPVSNEQSKYRGLVIAKKTFNRQ
jgi:hypothetical protein